MTSEPAPTPRSAAGKLHARASGHDPADLAARSGLPIETIRAFLDGHHAPAAAPVIFAAAPNTGTATPL
jgi:hypothetical protein